MTDRKRELEFLLEGGKRAEGAAEDLASVQCRYSPSAKSYMVCRHQKKGLGSMASARRRGKRKRQLTWDENWEGEGGKGCIAVCAPGSSSGRQAVNLKIDEKIMG